MPISINKIKLLRSLQQKKFRQKYNFFIAEGPKICIEALSSQTLEIVEIFAQQHWLEKHQSLLTKYQSIISVVTDKELKKVTTLKTPNLVLILAKTPDLSVNHSLITDGSHLFCDAIQDPGNLGTIIRIADWFGISSVTLNKGSVDPFNPKTVQSTMGAFLRVPIIDIGDEVNSFFSSFDHVYGAVMDGDDLYTAKLEQHAVYIIGNEGKGISTTIRNYCNHLISIPKHPTSKAESLNASVAAGIICGALRNNS